MYSYLDLIPDETKYKILTYLPHSDLVTSSEVESLSHIFDWDFWRKLAKDRLGISNEYFNLGSRSSGIYRYLELCQAWHPIFESLATIQPGMISGLIEFNSLFSLAVEYNHYQLVEILAPLANPSLILDIYHYYASSTVGRYKSIKALVPYIYLSIHIPSIQTNIKPEKIYLFVEKKLWDQIDLKALYPGQSQNVAAHLVKYPESQSFRIILQILERFPPESNFHQKIFRLCLRSGNFWRVSELIRIYPDIIRKDVDDSIIPYLDYDDPWQLEETVNYSYSVDAYIGANKQLISMFKPISPRSALACLEYGYIRLCGKIEDYYWTLVELTQNRPGLDLSSFLSLGNPDISLYVLNYYPENSGFSFADIKFHHNTISNLQLILDQASIRLHDPQLIEEFLESLPDDKFKENYPVSSLLIENCRSELSTRLKSLS